MSDMTILQVPISKALKKSAIEVATEHGFSSVQEVIRVFLQKFANRQMRLNIESMPVIKLSKRAVKRYDKMAKDFNKNPQNWLSFNNAEEFKKYIDSW